MSATHQMGDYLCTYCISSILPDIPDIAATDGAKLSWLFHAPLKFLNEKNLERLDMLAELMLCASMSDTCDCILPLPGLDGGGVSGKGVVRTLIARELDWEYEIRDMGRSFSPFEIEWKPLS